VTRYVAFLRAINVGGHVVKMDALKRSFEAVPLDNVSTFIASGNVIFESQGKAADLEPRIEAHLRQWFGYAVGTFVRSEDEVADIARHEPFAGPATTYIMLTRARPDAATVERVLALATEHEPVVVHEREVYFQPVSFLESLVSGGLGKVLGTECTMRNANTLRRLAAKFAAPPPPQTSRRSRKTSGSP
jgi:uncharacterized protein (DUF1697 family)